MRIVFALIFVAASAQAAIPPASKSDSFPEGERLVYSQLVQAFQKRDLEKLTKQKKLLESNYPASVHLGLAYFLIGALDYQQDHLGEALMAFDKVVNSYPLSSKRSAALYAMGMTYKKLNLPKQASSVFHRVIDLYPGSPDSQRAWLEIRLAQVKPKQKKKE